MLFSFWKLISAGTSLHWRSQIAELAGLGRPLSFNRKADGSRIKANPGKQPVPWSRQVNSFCANGSVLKYNCFPKGDFSSFDPFSLGPKASTGMWDLTKQSRSTNHQRDSKTQERTWKTLSRNNWTSKEDTQMPTDIWKVAQYHKSSGECKSKLQWNTISQLSEWLSSKNQHITSVGQDV